jgi:hypothetical protein
MSLSVLYSGGILPVRFAGFELLAVYQNRVRAVQPGAVAVIVAKNGELACLNNGLLPDLLFSILQ